jgi:hypothetical protein
MKRIAYLTLVIALALGVVAATAQEPSGAKAQTAIGAVKSVGGASFVLDVAKKSMSFNVDANTHVLAKGASTKTRMKKADGQGGLTVGDVVHEGDRIVVKYVESGGGFLATEIDVRNPRPESAQPVK